MEPNPQPTHSQVLNPLFTLSSEPANQPSSDVAVNPPMSDQPANNDEYTPPNDNPDDVDVVIDEYVEEPHANLNNTATGRRNRQFHHLLHP